MKPQNIYDTSLALAGVSFVTIVSALSVSTYDCSLVTGVAILCVVTPLLASFARWTPPDIGPDSTWYDWLANHLFILAMPGALLGISFVFAHVHIVCGVLFGLSSFTGISLYWRRVLQLKRVAPTTPKV
jgi:hypothetical protein